MKLSIIIPAYNEEKYIGQCLESLINETKGNTFVEEIIVINNASTDRTREVALSYGVRVVDEPNKGLTKARQRGLVEARGDLLSYIDADSKIPKGWLNKIYTAFTTRPNLVGFSGPYRYYDGSLFLRFILNLIWYISAPITYLIVGYMILGGNFVAKKSALIAMGGFDTTIEFYGEDTNIAWRLNKQGKVLFKMNFYVYSSSRRFSSIGIVKTTVLYALNFIWQVVFKKPFTNRS